MTTSETVQAEKNEHVSREEAREMLIEQGVLLRFNDLEVWHGRATMGEDWRVESSNGFTASRNVYDNILYGTLNKKDAQDFADKRSMRKPDAEPALHQLVATSDESLLLSREAAQAILPKELVGSPKKFASQQEWYDPNMNKVVADLLSSHKGLITMVDAHAAAQEAGVDEDVLREFVGVVNSYMILVNFQMRNSIAPMLSGRDYVDAGGMCDLSTDFVRSVLEQNGIVGAVESMNSATLGKTIDDVVVIWDFDRVQDKDVHEKGAKKALGRASLSGAQ